MKTLNPRSQPTFLQSDISLLKNVDRVCNEIRARESRLNLLFMTPGYMTLKGRDETRGEGLDRKLVLHYYARMRFIGNLLPLLTAAGDPSDPNGDTNPSREPGTGIGSGNRDKLSRVISILDPHVSIRAGGNGTLDYSDLSLKHSFSLNKCGAHASLMGNFYLEGMARRYPSTSFIHAYPSGVATGLLREVPGGRVLMPVLKRVLRPFMVPVEESGERHLFLGTSGRFPPRAATTGIEEGGLDGNVAVGSDGVKGSGCYWVNWDGEVFGPNGKLERVRDDGAVERVVKHTEEVFGRVCEEGLMYP